MKVSILQKTAETASNDPLANGKQSQGNEAAAATNPLDKYFKAADGDANAGAEAAEDTDLLSGWEAAFAPKDITLSDGTVISEKNFAEVVVPTVGEIYADLGDSIDMTELKEFYDELKAHYQDKKDRVYASIDNLLATLKDVKGTEMEAIVKKVLNARGCFLQKDETKPRYGEWVISEDSGPLCDIDEQMKVCDEKVAEAKLTYQREMDNLKIYGAAYYKWQVAFKANETYNGEPATYANKPDPSTFIPPIDIDGNKFIGDPNTMLLIGNRDITVDGKVITLIDVVNKETNRAVSFGEQGDMTDVGSYKDTTYEWTMSHGNLTKVNNASDIGADVMLQLNTTDTWVTQRSEDASDDMFLAPIDITIPEFVWYDPDGKTELIQDGKKINQKMGANGELKKVLRVDVTVKNGDYYIELKGKLKPEDTTLSKIFTIRVTGREEGGVMVNAADRAISLNGGYADDYAKRTSGIYVKTHSLGNASYTIDANIKQKIHDDYGISSNADDDLSYENFNGPGGTAQTGLLMYNFNVVAGDFTASKGNNCILADVAGDEMEGVDYDALTVDTYEDEIACVDPWRTNTLFAAGNSFSMAYVKSGNLAASGFGLVDVGRQNEEKNDQVYLVETIAGERDIDVAVNVHVETTESVWIANNMFNMSSDEDEVAENGAAGDDVYDIIGTTDIKFLNKEDPDVWNTFGPNGANLWPNETKTGEDGKIGTNKDPNSMVGRDAIENMIRDQMDTFQKMLAKEVIDTAADDDLAYGYGLYGPDYDAMKGEMKSFFDGWDSMYGGSEDSLETFITDIKKKSGTNNGSVV